MQTNLRLILVLSIFIGSPSLLKAQVGSVWESRTSYNQSMYAHSLASNIGDLVTIIVELSTATQLKEQTKTTKANTMQDAIDHLFYNMTDGTHQGYRYRNLPPSFEWGGSRSHAGDGSINNSETLTTTVEARVVDTLPNNVLRVQAHRSFTSTDETMKLVMTGLVRRDDLSAANTISSTKVSDLQIKQEGSGTLSRDQKKGFLTRMYESINPF